MRRAGRRGRWAWRAGGAAVPAPPPQGSRGRARSAPAAPPPRPALEAPQAASENAPKNGAKEGEREQTAREPGTHRRQGRARRRGRSAATGSLGRPGGVTVTSRVVSTEPGHCHHAGLHAQPNKGPQRQATLFSICNFQGFLLQTGGGRTPPLGKIV